MNDKRIMLKNLSNDKRNILGDSITDIILYGSYARGDNIESSDIDIMILTSLQDDEIVKFEDDIFDIAYDYELSDGTPISINIKNVDHFMYWEDTLPYYRNIAKEGVVIAG